MHLRFFAIATLLLAGQAQADILLAAGGDIEIRTDRPLDSVATLIREPAGKIALDAGSISIGEGGSLLLTGGDIEIRTDRPLDSVATLIREPAGKIALDAGSISIGAGGSLLLSGGDIEIRTDRPLDSVATLIREPAGKIALDTGNISIGEGGSLLLSEPALRVIESPLSAAIPVPPPRLTNTDGGGTINFNHFDIGSSAGIRFTQPDSGLANLRVGATTPIPEPESWAMLLAGIGLLELRRRQRA